MPRRRHSSLSGLSESRDYDQSTDEYSNEQVPSRGKPQQRNAANARERARMRVLSKAFGRLKTKLPWVPPDTKLSKLDTLRLATSYISHLQSILRDDHLNVPVHPRSLVRRKRLFTYEWAYPSSSVRMKITEDHAMEPMDELQDSQKMAPENSGELSGVNDMFPEENTSSSSWVHLPNRPAQNYGGLVCPMCLSLVDNSRLLYNPPAAVNDRETQLDQSELLAPLQSTLQVLSNPEESPLDLSVNGPNGRTMESNKCTVAAKCVDAGRAVTSSQSSTSNSPESMVDMLNIFISDELEKCDDESILSGKLIEELSSSSSMLQAKINNCESTSCESGCTLQSINATTSNNIERNQEESTLQSINATTSNNIERNQEEKVPTHRSSNERSPAVSNFSSPRNYEEEDNDGGGVTLEEVERMSWPFSFHQPTQQPRLSEWLNAEISMNTQTDATSSSHEDDMEDDSGTHHQVFQDTQQQFHSYSQL